MKAIMLIEAISLVCKLIENYVLMLYIIWKPLFLDMAEGS